MLPFAVIACSTPHGLSTHHEDHRIEVSFVQVNDVYEIAPLSGGREGGMARVATLKKKYSRQRPNTFLVMSGDFVSPPVYNSRPYQGQAVRGRQMIEAMNAAGVDFAIFGNHEFDIRENELQARINEPGFRWISSNAFEKDSQGVHPFHDKNGNALPQTYILTVHDAGGDSARIGLIGICIPANKASYVQYTDPLGTATTPHGH